MLKQILAGVTIGAVGIGAGFVGGAVYKDKTIDVTQKAEYKQMQNQNASLSEELDAIKLAKVSLEADIDELNKQIQALNTNATENASEIEKLKTILTEKQETISKLNSYINRLELRLKPENFKGTNIENNAYSGMKNLIEVELSDKVEIIGEYAFHNCSNLNEFIITPNLKIIEQHAFDACSSLDYFDFTNIESIGDFAFFQTGLREIRISADISLGKCVFQGAKINTVYIEEGVTTIPFGLLYGCGYLTDIYLPKTLKNIEKFGLKNYSGNVYFAGTQEEFEQISCEEGFDVVFQNANVVCNYPVPAIN